MGNARDSGLRTDTDHGLQFLTNKRGSEGAQTEMAHQEDQTRHPLDSSSVQQFQNIEPVHIRTTRAAEGKKASL